MSNWMKTISGSSFVTTLAATAPWVLLVIFLTTVAVAVWLASDRTRAENWSLMMRGAPEQTPASPLPTPPKKRWRLRRRDGPP